MSLDQKVGGLHRGIVVNDSDPEGLMRVRVQIPSLLGEMVSNWAWPAVPSTAGLNPPNVGDPIWITFEGDDIERPVYLGTWLPISNPNPPSENTAYVISGGTNVYSASASTFLASQIAGDTQRRFEVRAGGEIRWGSGTAAADVILARAGVGQLRLSGSRSTGANENTFVLADPVTGVQAAGFGQRILWSSNGGGTYAALAFEVGATGTNNESQIALYTQNVAGSLLRNWVLGSRGDVFHSVSSASAVGYILRAAAGQSATLQQWQNSAGTALIFIDSLGALGLSDSSYIKGAPTYGIRLNNNADTLNVLIAENSGNVLIPSGYLGLGIGTTPTAQLQIGGTTARLRFGGTTADTGPFYIDVLGSGGATPATKGTGFGRNLIIMAGASDNSGGLAGGDLYLRPGSPTAPANVYGHVVMADLGGNVGVGVTTPGTTRPGGDGWNLLTRKVLEIHSTDSGGGNAGLFLRRPDMATGLDMWADNYYGNAYIDNRYDNAAGNIYIRTRTAGTAVAALAILGTGVLRLGDAAASTTLRPNAGTQALTTERLTLAGRTTNIGTVVDQASIDASLIVVPGDASSRGILVRGFTSQTADLQQWQNSSGTVLASITNTGRLVVPGIDGWGTSTINGSLVVTADILTGSAAGNSLTQTGDYIRHRWVNDPANSHRFQLVSNASGSFAVDQIAGYDSGGLRLATSAGRYSTLFVNTGGGFIMRSESGLFGDLHQWQNSAGSALTAVSSAGKIIGSSTDLSLGGISASHDLFLNSGPERTVYVGASTNAAGSPRIVIRSASGQSVDIQRWENSGAAILAKIETSGTFRTSNRISAGTLSHIGGILQAQATDSGEVVTVFRGFAGQTVELQRWENSAGAALASMTAGGVLQFASATGQKINYYSAVYGMGVQNSTHYFRSDAGYAWHRQGTHVDALNDPGSGGYNTMNLDTNGALTVRGTNAGFLFADRTWFDAHAFLWYSAGQIARLYSIAASKDTMAVYNTGETHLAHTLRAYRATAQNTYLLAGIFTESSANTAAALTAHAPGVGAPMWKAVSGFGEAWVATRSDNAVYISVNASAFTVQSTEKVKENVRPAEKLKAKTKQVQCIKYNKHVTSQCPLCEGTGSPNLNAPRGLGKEPLVEGDPCPDCNGKGHNRNAHLTRNETRDQFGFSAEQLYPIFPEAVLLDPNTGEPGFIDLAVLASIAVRTTQELDEELAQLRAEFDAFKVGK